MDFKRSDRPARGRNGAKRPRILLVEDDDAVRRGLQLLLVAHGYDVRAYASGVGLAPDPEALQADCLVADLLIPGGDALGLIHELGEAGWSGVAILISGHLTDEWATLVRRKGYDAVLAKPIVETRLASCIAGLLDNRSEPSYAGAVS